MVTRQSGAHETSLSEQTVPAHPSSIPFGALVRDRRRALRLSLAALGERVGCAKSYLSAIETGHKPPPQEDLVRAIERALAVRDGRLLAAARVERTPRSVREELRHVRSMVNEARRLATMVAESAVDDRGRLEGALAQALASGEAHRLAARLGGGRLGPHHAAPEPTETRPLALEIPVIGQARAAGSEAPADGGEAGMGSVLVTPGVEDADAYAVRVVGGTMSPDVEDGDLVIASPSSPGGESGWADGSLRVLRLHGAKGRVVARVYRAGAGRVRVQPSVSSAEALVVSTGRVRAADAVVVIVRRVRAWAGV